MENSKEIIEIRHSLKELYESRNSNEKEIIKLQEADKAHTKDTNSIGNKQREIEAKIDDKIMPVLRKNALYVKIIWGLFGFFGIQTALIIFKLISSVLTSKIVG